MQESLRLSLYFILGFSPMLFFSLRFIIQWIKSEKKQKSHVTALFWYLSLFGNCLFTIHFFIQVQYPLFLIQVLNSTISYRQILLSKKRDRLCSRTKMLYFLGSISLLATFLFSLRAYLEFHSFDWVHVPSMPWEVKEKSISLFWHLLGFFGATLFASRFWIQWWFSEKQQKSFLGETFWWISITGACLTLSYGIYTQDIVMILGYVTGIIPYMRNLMLIYRAKKLQIYSDEKI